MAGELLAYVRDGFSYGLEDLGSELDLREARRVYRLKLYEDFLEHIFDNKQSIVSRYENYLLEQDIVDNSERPDRRLASKEQKKNLPNRCVLCEGPVSEYHHIVPHSAGGGTEERNLMPLCSSCHRCLGFSEVVAVEMLEEAVEHFNSLVEDV